MLSSDKLVLLSTHDSKLSKVSNGIKIDYDNILSNTSAIFIELWKNKDQEFVKINYEGEYKKFGIRNKMDFMNKIEFLKNLKILTIKNQIKCVFAQKIPKK